MNVVEAAERSAVVIVNWNGTEDTLACLASLTSMTVRPRQVIVVDNASSDDVAGRVASAFPAVDVLQAGSNLGYAGGNNLGIRRAVERGALYLWILNNDTVVHEDALCGLLERVIADPSIGLCGSTLLHAAPPHLVQAFGGARYDRRFGAAYGIGAGDALASAPRVEDVEARLDYVIGASMLATMPFVEGAGLMDEGYFLFFEELDWAARLPPGMRLGWAPGSIVYHKDGATIGKNRDAGQPFSKRFRYEYFLVRSKLRYTGRHEPARLPSIALGVGITLVSRLARGQLLRAWILLRASLAVLTGVGAPAQARALVKGGRP